MNKSEPLVQNFIKAMEPGLGDEGMIEELLKWRTQPSMDGSPNEN